MSKSMIRQPIQSVSDKQYIQRRHGIFASFNSIKAVAICEWRLQWRSIVFWLVLVLNITLTYFLVSAWFTTSEYRNSGSSAIFICMDILSYTLATVPFLVLNIFQRDQRKGMHAVLWSRPLSSFEYVIGKGLSAAFAGCIACLFPLFIGWIIASCCTGIIQPWQPWFVFICLLTISVSAITSLTILLISVLPPLVGVAISIFWPVFTLVRFSASLLDPTNIQLALIYYQLTNGFGPDTSLLVWQRICYILFALLCLILTTLFFHFSQKRSIMPHKHWILSVSLALILLVTFSSVGWNFIQLGSSYRSVSAAPAPLATAQFSHYSLSTKIDPQHGTLEGTASFRLEPQATSDTNIYVALLPSLDVQSITIAGQEGQKNGAYRANSVSNNGWTRIDLANTRYAQGAAVWITVQYQGIFRVSRDNYSTADGMTDLRLNSSNLLTSYVGDGMSFLGGDGASIWYPLPWTQQLAVYGNRLPMDTVKITFPATTTVVSALGSPQRSSDGQWQTISTEPHGPLPLAFIAAMSSPEQTTIAQMPVLYMGPFPDPTRLAHYDATIRQTFALAQWLEPADKAHLQWHAMVMPFLERPIIGPGVLLLPEYPFHIDSVFEFHTSEQLLRFAGGAVARAWWKDVLQGTTAIRPAAATPQSPQGSIQFFQTAPVLDSLMAYSAAITTDKLLGNGYLAQEESICAGDALGDRAKGIEYCPHEDAALYNLQDTYGREKVEQLLQTFAQEELHKEGSWTDLANLADNLLHLDASSSLASYICPSTKGAQTPVKPDPNTPNCLNDKGGA